MNRFEETGDLFSLYNMGRSYCGLRW